jgi:hypothetical protein
MHRMIRNPVRGMIAAATLALAGTAVAAQPPAADPGQAAESGPVEVYWADPGTFSEVRLSTDPGEAIRGDWVSRLADHLRDEAARRLAPGERLEVVIQDIDLAGDFMIGHAPTRIMRPLAAPMIRLSFVRRDANGEVVDYGERTLRDLTYLAGPASVDRDPLRYEKRLIDRWVSRELPAA